MTKRICDCLKAIIALQKKVDSLNEIISTQSDIIDRKDTVIRGYNDLIKNYIGESSDGLCNSGDVTDKPTAVRKVK